MGSRGESIMTSYHTKAEREQNDHRTQQKKATDNHEEEHHRYSTPAATLTPRGESIGEITPRPARKRTVPTVGQKRSPVDRGHPPDTGRGMEKLRNRLHSGTGHTDPRLDLPGIGLRNSRRTLLNLAWI